MEDNEDRDVNQILDKWLNLQKIIKEEITINEISNLLLISYKATA